MDTSDFPLLQNTNEAKKKEQDIGTLYVLWYAPCKCKRSSNSKRDNNLYARVLLIL